MNTTVIHVPSVGTLLSKLEIVTMCSSARPLFITVQEIHLLDTQPPSSFLSPLSSPSISSVSPSLRPTPLPLPLPLPDSLPSGPP